MVYTDYKTIPYPYLHDAALVLSKRFSLTSICMDKKGELCLGFKGKLNENQVKEILKNLNPFDSTDEDYNLEYILDYSYSDDMQETYVYTPDGIDYRKNIIS